MRLPDEDDLAIGGRGVGAPTVTQAEWLASAQRTFGVIRSVLPLAETLSGILPRAGVVSFVRLTSGKRQCRIRFSPRHSART